MDKLYCTSCSETCLMTIIGSGASLVIDGNGCANGRDFAMSILNNPPETLTATVRTKFPDVPVIPVKTDGEIPKSDFHAIIEELNEHILDTELSCGDVYIENIADKGVNIIITGYDLTQLGAELENNNDKLRPVSSSSSSRDSSDDAAGHNVDSDDNDALDNIGGDDVGGFVGAAGEAVGVDDAGGKEYIPQRSRPHING